jgi:pimeloyl-ACP methyl ester carboxylesterase
MAESFEFEGVGIAYEVTGAGEPVVLAGGSGMPIYGWDAVGLRPALVEAGHQVVAFAARGVAPSDAPAPPYGMADLVAEAAGLLEHLGLARCHLVGLSLGGFVVETLARERPDLTRSAVLIASAGPVTALARLMVAAQRDVVAAAGSLPASLALHDDVRVALPPAALRDDDAQVEQWAQMLSFDTWSGPDGRDGQAAAAWDWLEDPDRMARLADVAAPTLVVAYEHDPLFPPRCGRQAVAALPRGELAEIPGGAHAGVITHAEATRAAILEFLGRS